MSIFLWAAVIRIVQYFLVVLQAEYQRVSIQAV